MSNKKRKIDQTPKQQSSFPLLQASNTELAWLAELLQSEATFYIDSRVRSKSGDPEYTPPPPIPCMKVEMIEKDVMEKVGQLLGRKVRLQNRVTSAGNKVYRVSIEARADVEIMCNSILPYIIGKKTRDAIISHLKVCEEYNLWVAQGGKSAAGRSLAELRERGSAKQLE